MATQLDDLSQISVGATGAPFNPSFKTLDASGNVVPFPLVGCTISMKMQGVSASDSSTLIVCAGVWTITDAANGVASYAYTSTDVATAGVWTMYITITKGGKPVHADTKTLVILPAP